jgi:hypothetical protein
MVSVGLVDIKHGISGVSKIAGALVGALFALLEAWHGLGWRVVALAIVYCIWLSVLYIVTKRLWRRSTSPKLRAFVAGSALAGCLLPLPWVYSRGIDYVLLPDSSPAFRLTNLPYPTMLMVLPSQERTLAYYEFLKCRGSGHVCTSRASSLDYSVILFSEVGAVVGALNRSNLKPQLTFAASWLDNTEPSPAVAFHDKDVVVIGGPVSTAYFSLARDAIVAALKPNAFSSLPIDFSERIYSQASTNELYTDDSRNALVTRYDDTVPNRPAIPEKQSLALACNNGRTDYYAVAIPFEPGSPQLLPCTSGSSAVSAPPRAVAPHTHETDLEYPLDWGFFVAGPNPGAPGRQLVMAAGLHAEGSRCALRYLLDLTSSGLANLRRQADDLHTEHGYVTGLLRCESDEKGMNAPRLIRAAVF